MVKSWRHSTISKHWIMGRGCMTQLLEGGQRVDPLAEKYFQMSLYTYFANKPVLFKDPNGQNMDLL